MFPGGISNSKLVPLETHVNSRSDIFRIPDLLVVRIPIQNGPSRGQKCSILSVGFNQVSAKGDLILSNQTSTSNDPWVTSVTIDVNSLKIRCFCLEINCVQTLWWPGHELSDNHCPVCLQYAICSHFMAILSSRLKILTNCIKFTWSTL